jgi:hypothetical protein
VNESVPLSRDPLLGRLASALGPGYEVRRRVGGGGFAEVFEVWEIDLARRLAVKVLRPELAWTPEGLERFREEGRMLARLNHPNILPIYFVAERNRLIFIAMPFVEGHSLGELISTVGSLTVGRSLEIARPIIQALGHAHQNGLVHRDIKPDNILLERRTHHVLLVDFGVAKQLQGSGVRTAEGWPVGSPHYMSPEQAMTGKVDSRSDLYSVGATLYEMLTGVPPFSGNNFQEIMAKHAVEPPPDPRERNRRVPGWLATIVSRCLAKKPEDRPQSAEDLLQLIDNAWDDVPDSEGRTTASTVAAPAPKPERLPAGGAPSRTPGEITLRIRISYLVVTGVALLALVVWGVGRRPTGSVTVRNRLVEPIRVRASDGSETLVLAGRERSVSDSGKGGLEWSLVRPISDSGVPMGSELKGLFPAGAHGSASSWQAEQVSVAPVIVNATARAVTIAVSGTGGRLFPCHCSIPAGAGPTRIGYYPLLLNSSLIATDADGRRAIMRLDSDSVDDRGAITVRLTPQDFR